MKRNFLAGRAFRDVHEANERVLVWCIETAGRRIHGTTKEQPLARFDTIERDVLLPRRRRMRWRRGSRRSIIQTATSSSITRSTRRRTG